MKKERLHKIKYGTISLPMHLINKIKKRIEFTGMSSVSGYVTFILRQVLSAPEEDESKIIGSQTELEVKRRLRELGYI